MKRFLLNLALRYARPVVLDLIEEGLDLVRREALEVVDGRPDADGNLGALERSMTEAERIVAKNAVVAVIARLSALAREKLGLGQVSA